MANTRILIVEDQLVTVMVIKNALESLNYSVCGVASTGENAIQKAAETRPDLVLMDIKLKGDMDGIEAAGQIRTQFDIPVVYLTAYNDDDTLQRAKITDPFGYIIKPIEDRELYCNIEIALSKKELEKKLKEANAAKDKFFSIISHDLRNGYNSIISGTDMLQNTALDPEMAQEVTRELNLIAWNQFKLLENLLEWSRMQTNRIDFQPENIELDDLIKHELYPLNNTAQQKEISLISSIDPVIKVCADYQMIATVIRNLTANGLKFTKAGGSVEISAQVMTDFVEISISDTGVGIPGSVLPELFRIESRYKKQGTSGENGTGLGLLLCKEFVEKNGGKIWAESEMDQGSVFKFTLPRGG